MFDFAVTGVLTDVERICAKKILAMVKEHILQPQTDIFQIQLGGQRPKQLLLSVENETCKIVVA